MEAMGHIQLGDDRMIAPDVVVATFVDALGRLLRAECIPFVLSFDGPHGRHARFITAESRLEMVVDARGPVAVSAATVNALVETTLGSGVLVLDLASMDELDIDLMRSDGD